VFPCPKFAFPGRSRCAEHQAKYWRDRLRQRDPEVVRLHNSTAWKRLRELKRQQTPYCEICETQGRLVPVEQVDHIERVQDRPDLALVLENLRSLCMSCHSRRTRTDMNRERNR
jgi:5-methylcytosine-specific restriction enzyme A